MSQRAGTEASGGHRRHFLFLQGPHGSFFPRLGEELRRRGHRVTRVNLNGGDRATWPRAEDFHGRNAAWPGYVQLMIADRQITDLVLFGDCRPYHAGAITVARDAALRVHVFEEGYLRPDWVTLQRDGVNGYSGLPRDPHWYRAVAAALPPIPIRPPLPSFAAQRRWGAFFYYAQATLQRWRFPFGPSHRPDNPIWEGLSYLAKFRRAAVEQEESVQALAELADQRYMLFPLQLSSDYQIRVHSPFPDMRSAVEHVIESFARAAPADLVLVAKEHPLDSGLIRWQRIFGELSQSSRLGRRLVFVRHGELDPMVQASIGMVTVNSTSGAVALAAGRPVKVLGAAVYDVPELTDQQPLDRFWAAPKPPDPALFDAFARVLAHRCMLRGAFLDDPQDTSLVIAAADRLEATDA